MSKSSVSGTTATNNDLFKVDYEYGELQTNGTVDTTKNIGNIAKATTTIPPATANASRNKASPQSAFRGR